MTGSQLFIPVRTPAFRSRWHRCRRSEYAYCSGHAIHLHNFVRGTRFEYNCMQLVGDYTVGQWTEPGYREKCYVRLHKYTLAYTNPLRAQLYLRRCRCCFKRTRFSVARVRYVTTVSVDLLIRMPSYPNLQCRPPFAVMQQCSGLWKTVSLFLQYTERCLAAVFVIQIEFIVGMS